MKILIVGAGAMGSLFAGKLMQGGNNVTLFNRWNDHVKQIQNTGLTIVDKDDNISKTNVSIITNPLDITNQYDLVIVLVKTFATKTVLQNVIPNLHHQTPILTLQNGIGNVEQIEEIAPDHDIFVGVTYAGASVEKPGVILHRAWGNTYIGGSQSEQQRSFLQQVATILSKSELQTEVSDDVESVIWNKLFTNIAYNGLTAVTRLKNGDTLLCKEGKDIITKLVKEAEQIANIKKVHIPYSNPVTECIRLGEEEIGMNTSSMLSDILHDRKTEVEAINGSIVAEGKRHGIPTPYNEMMLNLIKLIENSYDRMVQ